MKEIPLTKGKVALVDDDKYEWLISLGKWNAHKSRHTYYARLSTKYVNGERETPIMHRIILGAAPGIQVDHVDGDGLNNQLTNLRLATQSQNSANKIQRNNTSGYKGVRRATRCVDSWYARIGYKNRQIYIGLFPSKEEAALAYNSKALELFGEYAKLNQIYA